MTPDPPARALTPAEVEQRREARITHGARSEARIAPAARAQKRRLLRQIGLAAADMDGIGKALLDVWARSAAKVDLLDRHYQVRGFTHEDGVPAPSAQFHLSALNSTRLALQRLEAHLADRRGVAGSALHNYLIANYGTTDVEDAEVVE